MYSLLNRFMADEAGATSIEYALLGTGVSLAIITAVNSLGSSLSAKYASFGAAIQ